MAKQHYHESPTPAQKSSFKSYLSEDEELILVTGLGHVYLRQKFIIYLLIPGMVIGGIIFGILAFIFKMDQISAVIIGLLIAVAIATLKTIHTFHANRYLFTTRRVIIKQGLFSVKLMAALYDKITHLEVDQSFVDRLFLHHGTIVVNTAGSNKDEIVLRFVDYPMELKNLLERLITREREHMGLHPFVGTTIDGEII